jgi:trehalose-6-phosphatase
MAKIAFDIDDTLWKIDVKHKRQVPDYDLIQVLRWFVANGDEVFVWSAGGMDYAQTIVDKLGLTDHVTVIQKNGVLMKDLRGPAWKEQPMDIAFDDVEVGLATVNVKVKREPRDEFTDTENPLGKIYSNK